mmetsp:Transcript_23655/g.39037  ORF Transcript_23655/g.39037 Transcript_23655/m.39037 type:complete len:363 (+) Transcript_23655:170-1258(+)
MVSLCLSALLSMGLASASARAATNTQGHAYSGRQRLVTFSSHSGFGNQLEEITNALILAQLIDRTLMLPPILDHFSGLTTPSCGAASQTNAAKRALALYAKRAMDRGHGAGFNDVWDMQGVAVSFDARQVARGVIDVSANEAICSSKGNRSLVGYNNSVQSLSRRNETLVMVGSTRFAGWPQLYPSSIPVPRRFGWARSTFSTRFFKQLGRFSCFYSRLPDNYHKGTHDYRMVRTSLEESCKMGTCCQTGKVYISTNDKPENLCSAVLHRTPVCANVTCLNVRDLILGEPYATRLHRFTPSTRNMLLDMFTCSHSPDLRGFMYYVYRKSSSSSFLRAIQQSQMRYREDLAEGRFGTRTNESM